MSYEEIKKDKWLWIMVSLIATLGPVAYTVAGTLIFIETGFYWVLAVLAIMLMLLWYGVYQLFQMGLLLLEWNKEFGKAMKDNKDVSALKRKGLLDAIQVEKEFRYSLLQRNDFDVFKLKQNKIENELYNIAGNLIELYEEMLTEDTRRFCNEDYD